MQTKINELLAEARKQLEELRDAQELESFKVRMLGKKGRMTELLRGMGALPAEERPAFGKLVNEARAEIERALETKTDELRTKAEELRLKAETLDVTIPGTVPEVGHLHPMTHVIRRVEEIFVGMGFTIAEGPEVELDHYNFELLNLPKNHPARDMQDSFFINESMLLRTHTSPVQARTMTTQKPPIRIICPGRTYRFDEVDATHSPVFHQVEGLVIDKGINMGHLKQTLDVFVKQFYGEHVGIRLRPSFFPFTEPSAEMDITCYVCGGKDEHCRVCHGTGWIEVLGCGMVNPKVLTLCGIDPEVYSGFAFGVGWDRITNGKYGISDMRLNFENDLRFLRQF